MTANWVLKWGQIAAISGQIPERGQNCEVVARKMKSLLKALASQRSSDFFGNPWRRHCQRTVTWSRERRRHEELARRLPEQVFVDQVIQKICPDLTVRHGFFQGMHYRGTELLAARFSRSCWEPMNESYIQFWSMYASSLTRAL